MKKITIFKKNSEKNHKKSLITVRFLDSPMLATDARFVYVFQKWKLKGVYFRHVQNTWKINAFLFFCFSKPSKNWCVFFNNLEKWCPCNSKIFPKMRQDFAKMRQDETRWSEIAKVGTDMKKFSKVQKSPLMELRRSSNKHFFRPCIAMICMPITLPHWWNLRGCQK